MQRMYWDYLILTASNDLQAQAYEEQLALRKKLGLLQGVRNAMVLADPGGKRVGSGGSTVFCLAEILSREMADRKTNADKPELWLDILEGLRILIMHAGGDSKRLPAYSPCGKVFVPMPGESDSCLPLTLFDRQLPIYLALPSPGSDTGQIVITAGDVLLRFDSERVRFADEGLTGLACYADPEAASRHGVFCRGQSDTVRLFLQKPTPAEQDSYRAVDSHGRTLLDIGVMCFTAEVAVTLLQLFGLRQRAGGRFQLAGDLAEAIPRCGLDFYQEICCGMGSDVTLEAYLESLRRNKSKWDESLVRRFFDKLSCVPFHVRVLPECEFLHFGTSQQLISSGHYVLQQENRAPAPNMVLTINTEVCGDGRIAGSKAWVEGCRVSSTLQLAGENLVAGIDIGEPLSLPVGACVDVVPGRSRNGDAVWFVRCYDVHDRFNTTGVETSTFCGRPLNRWLEAVGCCLDDVWPTLAATKRQDLWDARLFPAVGEPGQYRAWLWMLDPDQATEEQRQSWRSAERYSLTEMAVLADLVRFHQRRQGIRARALAGCLHKVFGRESGFSTADLAYLVQHSTDQPRLMASLVAEARRWHQDWQQHDLDRFIFPRVIHTLASALSVLDADGRMRLARTLVDSPAMPSAPTLQWLKSLNLDWPASLESDAWPDRARSVAFESLGQAIMATGRKDSDCPRNRLRSDEIVWGRAPARLDTGGGWTDTPPYSLERGGCVVNTAVDLNGQSPIQVYLRIIGEPVIRIGSIDLGTRIEIRSLDDLLDYRRPNSEYSLAKASLALSGFAPGPGGVPKGTPGAWPDDITLGSMLEFFGGGIELTTLAAVPKGSGLGTSSIMGAVLLAVIGRATGRHLTHRELFHAVLRLEQALTTGGGWQDQIGGVVGGSKIISTDPGLIPDARIHYVIPDVLDPIANEGQTLLYYTGITRLAKGILSQVVGHYLNRDRGTMATLHRIHALAPHVAEAMSRKDIRAFGEHVRTAWDLNKQLDPGSTNEHVEALLSRIEPHVYGSKLLGAGGGGFLLMVCKSSEDAKKVRQMLDREPPNPRARFFDYQVNTTGLVVTVC